MRRLSGGDRQLLVACACARSRVVRDLVMKWLLLTSFLLWARHGEGGALKCLPGDEDCLSQQSEEIEQQEIDIRRPSGSTDAPFECLPGSEWESNCHRCRCLDGEAQCLRQPDCNSIDEPIRCAPNTTFERECNTCVCLHSGLGLCTVEPCERIPTEAPVPSKPIVPRGVDCAPGTTWQSQCNDCVCSPDGHRYCTERACPGQESEPLLRCAPQSQWKNDCNMCWCNSGRAMCTKMGCAGMPKFGLRVLCGVTGRAMCTKMGCAGMPSDMHFDDEEDKPNKEVLSEPDELTEVPDLNSNDLLESDRKGHKYASENIEDFDTTDQADKDLTGLNLKDLDDYDHNDVDAPIQIPDQVISDIAESKARDEDEELLEDLLSSDYKNETAEESVLSQNSESSNKDVEVLDNSYSNYHTQGDTHRVQKRSACKPNQEFQNDCNTCKCSANGESYTCTQNECMDRDKEEVDKEVEVFAESEGADHVERHSVCKPSATFYVGCNPCHCNSDGTDYNCTNKPCPLPEDVEVFHELSILKAAKNNTKKVCVENRMFIKDCNTCWCNEDGTSYFCTRKVCVQDTEPVVEGAEGLKSSKNSTKKVCVENRMFIKDCNTCWCNEDGTSYFCTRKVCVQDTEPVIEGAEKLRIIQRECRPGEVFEVDCNMCRCNADGQSFSCTRRACVDQDSKNQTVIRKTRATSQEARKNCLPEQEFRLDCNTCLCDKFGQDFSCTRIDCAALNNKNGARRKRDVSQKVSADCVPGSVFDQGCNVCRCTEDGGHATCTLKRCARANENSTLTATESSFRCNPGEQFRQSCNDCSCSADGKSVFCTLRVCDDDLAP